MGTVARLIVVAAVGIGVWSIAQRSEHRTEPRPSAPIAVPKRPHDLAPSDQRAAAPPDVPLRSVVAPPSAEPPSTALFATAVVRVRDGPGTQFRALGRLAIGDRVEVADSSGDWRKVSAAGLNGWVHGSYLAAAPPQTPIEPAGEIVAAPALPSAPPPALQRTFVAPQRSRGDPIREPYVGRCDCPYDLMRNGRRCGGNSAYSRPGGRNPVCYE